MLFPLPTQSRSFHATSGKPETAWQQEAHRTAHMVQTGACRAEAQGKDWSWQQFKCVKVSGEELGMRWPYGMPPLRRPRQKIAINSRLIWPIQ